MFSSLITCYRIFCHGNCLFFCGIHTVGYALSSDSDGGWLKSVFVSLISRALTKQSKRYVWLLHLLLNACKIESRIQTSRPRSNKKSSDHKIFFSERANVLKCYLFFFQKFTFCSLHSKECERVKEYVLAHSMCSVQFNSFTCYYFILFYSILF